MAPVSQSDQNNKIEAPKGYDENKKAMMKQDQQRTLGTQLSLENK